MVFMRNRTRTKSVARAALGGLFAITLLFAAAAAAFAEDDADQHTVEQKIIKNIMKGMGADVDKDRIDFRERSPLVIPPTRDLPPPQEAGQITNPAWPKDPDKVKPARSPIRPGRRI